MNKLETALGSLFILFIWELFSIGTSAEALIVIILINIYWELSENRSAEDKSKAKGGNNGN